MKNPFVLLVNDLHIDSRTIDDFNLNWDEALQVCKDRKISEIVIGGDLWTSRAAQTLPVLNAVRNALLKASSLNIFVTIANGNHCKIDQESLIGYSTIFDAYQNVSVIDEYDILMPQNESGIELLVFPYFPENGSFISRLEKVKKEEAGYLQNFVLYIHEGIHGALGNMEVPNELPQEIFKEFHSVLVGHYHNRTKIKGTKIEYIGASRQHSFGEDEEKGYTILFDDGTTEFIQNQVNVRYKTIAINYQQLLAGDYELDCSGKYLYRLKLKCSSEEMQTVDRRSLMEKGFKKIEFVTEKTIAKAIENTDIEEKFDKAGIQREYLNFCNEKGIDSKIGLEYLDKIN